MEGIYNLYIPLCGLFIAILCNIVFFSKERAKNKETAIFSRILIYSLVDSVLMVTILCLAIFNSDNIRLMEFLNKIDYAIYILFSSNFFLYVYYVTSKENENQKVKLYNFFFWCTTILDVIFVMLLSFMKVNVHIDGNAMYSDGMALTSTIIGCCLYLLASIVCLFANIKKAITRKLTPLYVLILFFILVFILNQIDKTIVIVSFVFAFVNLVMLFTIENPDLKMVKQLNIAKQEADKSNQAKTDFLSSMSHEIRTPLNAIVGFNQCIAEAKTLEEAKENSKDVITAANTLLEIINGILDISKIESGKLELTHVKYQPRVLFDEVIKLLEPRINEKGLEFNIKIEDDLPYRLKGDQFNLKKCIINLLTNAVKYTDKGTISLSVTCINEENVSKLIISVEDTGHGIKNEDLEKIFSKFQRLEEYKNSAIEGTGLGLAITKQIIELMGGKVVVQSVYEKGSKFTIFVCQEIIDMKPSNENVQKIINEENQSMNFKSKTVLIVDDNNLNLKVASKLLEKYEVIVDTASSGFECIEKLKNIKYDLILMDDMMPNMSGTETLHKLKENPEFDIPVIALTANALVGMRENYIKEGFSEYLSKPINRQELEEILKHFFGNNKKKPINFDDTRTLVLDFSKIKN